MSETGTSHTHRIQTRLYPQPICHNMNDEHTLTHTYHPLPEKVFHNTDMHFITSVILNLSPPSDLYVYFTFL